jgi:hypothetical protein
MIKLYVDGQYINEQESREAAIKFFKDLGLSDKGAYLKDNNNKFICWVRR